MRHLSQPHASGTYNHPYSHCQVTPRGPLCNHCRVTHRADALFATVGHPVAHSCRHTAPAQQSHGEDFLELTHAVVVVGQLKAGEAEAVVGADCVLAGPVSAGLSVTLINICREKVTAESGAEGPESHCPGCIDRIWAVAQDPCDCQGQPGIKRTLWLSAVLATTQRVLERAQVHPDI